MNGLDWMRSQGWHFVSFGVVYAEVEMLKRQCEQKNADGGRAVLVPEGNGLWLVVLPKGQP